MNLERKNKRLLLNEIQDAVDICRAEGNNDIDKKKKSRQQNTRRVNWKIKKKEIELKRKKNQQGITTKRK